MNGPRRSDPLSPWPQRLAAWLARGWHGLVGAPPGAAPLAVQQVQLALLLQKTGPLRILSPIPFATPLALVFWHRTASWLPLLWLGLFCIAVGVTYVRRRRLQARNHFHDEELPAVLRGRIRDIGLLGTLWGLAPWMLGAHRSLDALLLISLFIMGAVSLGSAIVSTHRSSIAAFSVPAAAGMLSACAWHGGLVGWVLAASMALYLAMTLKWTFQQADLLQESLTVRFDKEALAQDLAQQVALVENANREKSRFLAAASHDLRQPLHAIAMFSGVLQRSALDPDSAQTVARLGLSVQLLNQSLDTMLDLSRLDAGAVPTRREAVRVHGLFLSLHHSFGERAQQQGLQMRFRAPGDLSVLSDPELLARLLGNLIDNALKYTPRGGVLVTARPRAGALCIEVVDTGIGMAQEHQAQVFDEFVQLGNPQRDRALGLGLGLSIVKRLCSLLEHPLEMHSRPGRGTRFRLWLPPASALLAPAPAAAPAPALPDPPQLPRQVLVLDDDPLSREGMASLLSRCGCTVHTASGPEQAQLLLRRHAIEAVVADWRLPGERSGLDFLIALRDSTPALRSVLVTGETAPQRIAQLQASGLPFLHKPATASALLQALAGPTANAAPK